MNWREQALCAQVDPDLWFPEKGESSRAAQRICATCPVQKQCLADALATHERFGIWGGLSTRQRGSLSDGVTAALLLPAAREPKPRRERVRPGCGTEAGYHRHWRQHEFIDDACREAHNRAAQARAARKAQEAA